MRFLNRPLRILLATDILVLVSGGMLLPFYSTYVKNIGGDILDAGIAAGLFAVAAGFSALFFGKLSDGIKRQERVVAVSYMVTAAGFLAMVFVDSVLELMAVQVVIGLAQASYSPAYDALYTKHIGTKIRQSSRWSIWESANYFSIAAGAVAGAAILHYGGFTALFAMMATLCAFSSLYLFCLPKRLL